MQSKNHGVLFALAAFLMWGLAPIYFKSISHIDALEILVHRVVWSFIFLVVIVLLIKQWHKVKVALKSPKTLGLLCISASLLGFNWGLFIWAVNNEHMLEASLGYYINPLLNVLLGVVFLHERLRKWQLVAVGLAISGVLIQLVTFGSFPLIAFSLASSFAVYGLIRKKMSLESLPGLLLESLLMLPLALIYWWGFIDSQTADLANNSVSLNTLLVSAGVVTTLPLLCFIAAAKRLNYSTLGIFQYLGPSLMFLLAVFVYGENFTADKAVTFICIWSALALFSWESFNYSRKQKRS